MKFSIKIITILFLAALATLNVQLVQSVENMGELINKAGKQRMLSQRIAKDYFYVGLKLQESRARAQLDESLAEFQKNHADLKQQISDRGIRDMLTFVDLSLEEFLKVAKKTYTSDNGALMLDLSEAMLEASQNVVEQLEAKSKLKTAEAVNIAGRQRMLSQRVAKYYIAHKAGFQDPNTVQQLQKSVKDFESALRWLKEQPKNTPQLQTELANVDQLWETFRKIYVDVTNNNLPLIVFVTADKIMDNMNQITAMYAALYADIEPAKPEAAKK